MLQNDASQTGSTPEARNDLDILNQCDLGPATGNAITGAGTVTGAAGADSATGATIVAVNGAESVGGVITVEGQYGTLTVQADGSYTYTRSPNAPDGVNDVFTYTLADSAGARDTATLTIELRCAEEPDEAQNLVNTTDGVVMLPAGVELSDIRVVGRDLIITLPDGSTITVPNGAVFVPQIVIGDVEVPPANLAALLIDSEPQPAAGTPESSGGNFAVDVPPLDPGVPLGDLLPPTDFGFTPPEFEEVGQFIDEEPEIEIQPDGQPASSNAVDSVDEAGLPARGNEPPGSNEGASSETTSGVILIDSADEPSVVTINGVAVTEVGQEIAGEFGTLTITSISDGAIGYSYTLTDNTSGDSTHDDFTVTITDNDGDTDTATLTINIVDDVPTAVNDTDSIAAGEFGPATGNVLTDADAGDAGDGDDGADTLGADDAELTDVSGAGETSVNADGSFVVEGEYGVLTIAADGSYSYVRNAGTPGGVTDTFTYTLTDGDGDSDTATLTIDIGDLAPDAGDNPTVLLDDDALAGGNPGGTGDDVDSANTSGTLSGAGGDGEVSFDLQTSGAPDGFTYVDGPDGSVLVQQGGVTVLTITIDAETGEYTVTQNAAIEHPAGGNENNVEFTIGYTVTDADGDSATGSLTINVDDDTPTISRTATAAPAIAVDETNLALNASGDFSGLFSVSYGADGPGTTTFALGVVDGTDSGLVDVATGESILLFDNNGVIEGRVGGEGGVVAFTVSVDGSTGVVTLDQVRALQHPDATNPDDSVTLDAGSIQLSATATDSDGDPVSETIDIGASFSFDDDGPTVGNAVAGAGVTLDETEAGSPAGFPISATSNGAAIDANAAFGADGEGTVTYGLSLSGGTNSGLATAIGDFPITLVQIDGDTIQGQYNGTNVAFTIQMNADGSITVTQEVPLEHLVDGSTEAAYDDALDLAGLIEATVTLTDADGDTASGSAAIGANIVFEDDGPAIDVTAAADAGVVLQTQDADTIGGASDSDSSTADFSGVFDVIFDGGADGAAGTSTTTFALAVQSQGVNSGLAQGGSTIFLYLMADGTVVGSTASDLGAVNAGNTVFDVTVDADGVVTLTQHSQIDHPIGDDPTATEAPFADQIASIADDLISLTATSTVTDNDGDTATDTASVDIGANLQFADDGPTISASATQPTLVVDETDLAVNDSEDFSAVFTGTYGADGPGTTSYALGIAAGATGIVDTATGEAVVLVMNNGVVEGRTATSGELVFTVSVDADGNVALDQLRAVVHDDPADADESGLSAVTLASDNLITLTATITDADGDTDSATVGIGQNLQFEDDGPDAEVDGTAGTDTLVLDETRPLGTETDGDSDPAGLMTVTANFADNFVTPEDFGADGAGSAAYSLVLNGSDVPSGLYALDSSDMTAGDGDGIGRGDEILLNQSGNTITGSVNGVTYFTISIDTATGQVTFTQTNNVWHSNTASDDDTASLLASIGSIFVQQTLTDGDGDTDSAQIDVSRGVFQIEDDGPTATDDSDSVPAGPHGTADGNVLANDDVGSDGLGGVTSVTGFGGSDSTYDASGNLVVQGEFGELTINRDGSYTYVRDDGKGAGDSDVFTYTLTDADGDSVTATLTIGIGDTIPVATGATAAVDDDGLAGANPAGTNDIDANTYPNPDDLDGPASSEASFTGMLGVTGGDGDIDFSLIAPGGSVAVGQETVTFSMVAGVLTATIATSPDAGRVGDALFTVSLDQESGEYTVTLVDNVLHGNDAANDEDGTEVSVDIPYQVSDADGDASAANGTLTIVFNDDVPTAKVSTGGFSISHDENPGNQGDADDVTGPLAVFAGVTNTGDDPDVSGTGAIGFALSTGAIGSTGTNFGADGGSAQFSLAVSAQGADSGLQLTDGTNIFLFVENGIIVGRAGADAAAAATGVAAFAVAIDSATGEVSLVQYLSIEHPIGGPSSTDESVSITNGAVLAVVTATDADGDTSTASAAIGDLISFQDDAPNAKDDTAGQLTEGANVTVDVFANDGEGADGVDLATGVAVVPGTLTGSGTLTYNGDGTFTYDPAPNEEGTVTFDYQITDGDGDTDVATVTLNLKPDSQPKPANATASVDDEGLPNGITGGDGDLAVPNTDGDNNEATFSGTLTADFGDDGPGTFSFAGMDGATGTIGTETVEYSWDAGSNTLTATITSGARTGTDLFQVAINPTSGQYSVTLLTNVLHADQLANTENDATAVLTFTATDSELDSANGSLTITFDDDMPEIFDVDTTLNLDNVGTPSGTGAFDFGIGADQNADFDDIAVSNFAVSVNGVALATTDFSLTPGAETATQANYTFSFEYDTGNGTMATAEGTLVFNKADGTYSVELTSGPIEGFSILDTGSADASDFVSYQVPPGGSGSPEVTVAALDSNFFVQFSGVAEPGSGTGSNNLTTTQGTSGAFQPVSTTNFDNLELFTQAMSTIQVSSDAAGVAGNTIQGGEVLDFNLYATDPGGTLGMDPTASSTSMFIQLDGVGSSEDMIVVLKLYDTATGQYTTRAVVVQNADIITTNAELAGTAYAGISLDNNDGLVVIEANDYQQGNSNLVIVGAQIAGSDEGITGSGINLNGDVGASGGSSGTQDFSTDVSDSPFKITSIGFVTSSTKDQDASLSFDVTVEDADGDAVTQSITVDIGDTTSNLTTTADPGSKGPVVQESIADKSTMLASDGFEQQLKSVNAANSNTVFLGAIAAAGLTATPAAAHHAFAPQAEFTALNEAMFDTLDSSLSRMSVDVETVSRLADKGGATVQDVQAQASVSTHSDVQQGDLSIAGAEGHANAAPVELPGGTGAPVQAPAAEVAPVAMSVAMPSAEALAAAEQAAAVDGGAKGTGEVARVLADALAGGGDGPDIDAVIDAAAGGHHGGMDMGAIAASLADVPAWDMGGFHGFMGSHSALTMEAIAIHPDAPATAA